MIIDCDTCCQQGTNICNDCVVTFILHEGLLELREDEAAALGNLATEGLIPGLRLVVRDPAPEGRRLARSG
jgi:hypothetical protein